LGPAPFGGLLVTAAALLLLRALERASWRRDLALGAALGFSTLTLAAAQVLVPLSAACIVLFRGWRDRRSWAGAALVALSAAAIIAPWTARNGAVFGEVVPVRTGAGLIAHQGNPILAASFYDNPQACSGA